MRASILGIEIHLPESVLSNEDLIRDYPDWSVERISEKTGIEQRHIAAEGEFASDLAYKAALKLFASGIAEPGEIDYLLFCTQSPDYLLPTTACLLQQRLGLPRTSGALDFNLGCSGYIYGLGLAEGLIASGQANRILLLTAETYSKFLDPKDRSSVTIFGDGAAATLIGAQPLCDAPAKSAYVYGTDGTGAEHLIVRGGSIRERTCLGNAREAGSGPEQEALWMNGPEIFHFTLRVVPDCVRSLLSKVDQQISDVDLFVFHQANRYMLDHLRKKLGIAQDKFFLSLASTGNTVSSTIPIALKDALDQGKLRTGQRVMLVGFGVGLSWGATLLSWPFLGYSL